LRFSKLLKLHQTEGRISSNLLKRKQSSGKTSIVCRWLYAHSYAYSYASFIGIHSPFLF